jgi:hypothetical protein
VRTSPEQPNLFTKERTMKQYLLGMSLIAVGLSATITGQSSTQKISGYVVDTVCAVGSGTKPGYAANHDKTCHLMAGCIKSGYSLVTADNKVLKFDQKGADLALALIKATDKDKDWKVVVTGKVDGQTIAVDTIALQ